MTQLNKRTSIGSVFSDTSAIGINRQPLCSFHHAFDAGTVEASEKKVILSAANAILRTRNPRDARTSEFLLIRLCFSLLASSEREFS